MKTVRDACVLQDNALSIKLSDQIEQLDELINAEGDGSAFFEKTHITQGMQDLSVRLRINPQNAGPAPRIPYAEDGPVSESSPQLKDQTLTTKALRVNFLVMDPSNQFETGDPVTWSNKLFLRNELFEEKGARRVSLLVAPKGTIRYTLDGSEARGGTAYDKPVAIGDNEVILRVFAEASGLEVKAEFRFPKKNDDGPPPIDPTKPATLVSRTGRKLDSRAKTYECLKLG